MAHDFNRAMREGVADAVGFVLGALAGWWLGRQFGIDFIASTEWNVRQVTGLLLIVAGCGVGRLVARRLILKDKP
jgi:membrane protein YqaA with SNARE-associated domain